MGENPILIEIEAVDVQSINNFSLSPISTELRPLYSHQLKKKMPQPRLAASTATTMLSVNYPSREDQFTTKMQQPLPIKNIKLIGILCVQEEQQQVNDVIGSI